MEQDMLAGDPVHTACEQESATPARLAETLVALANGAGGTLLIRSGGRSAEPPGLKEPQAALERVLRAALSTDPPLIIPFPQIVDADGGPVVVATVPPGLPHLYSYRGRHLVRDGERNRLLDARQLRRLMMERGAVAFESLVPEGVRLSDLDWEKVERYALSHGPATSGAREVLLRRGCLTHCQAGPEGRLLSRAEASCRGDGSTEYGDLFPTYAGLLLFGHDPQRWVHASEVLVARYAGTSMADRFIKEEIRGTLPEQIRQAEAFVLSNLRRGVRLASLERLEESELPPEVVREAIVNAVAHRDYQVWGEEIRILLFSDRLEVYSPGRLPGHVTVANIVEERYSRNESIVQVLADMGFIERLGYGIDRMIRQMREAGLPAPRLEETAAGFQVTLFGHGSSLIAEQVGSDRWRQLGLNERQELALAYLSEKGRITNRDFQDLCPEVSAETIRRDLADMVAKNLLLKIGEKRATYYILK